MEMQETVCFDAKDVKALDIEHTLIDVFHALEERGYNPYNQIVGYLISGDPGYISSHKEARTKIVALDRTEILDVLVKNYLDKRI